MIRRRWSKSLRICAGTLGRERVCVRVHGLAPGPLLAGFGFEVFPAGVELGDFGLRGFEGVAGVGHGDVARHGGRVVDDAFGFGDGFFGCVDFLFHAVELALLVVAELLLARRRGGLPEGWGLRGDGCFLGGLLGCLSGGLFSCDLRGEGLVEVGVDFRAAVAIQ